MTDREYPDYTDGVWDDGEWISWDWINGQLHQQELQSQYPKADPEVVEVFAPAATQIPPPVAT